MCIGVHEIVSFGDQSAKAEKSLHLILMIEINIWFMKISYAKMGYKHFDHNILLLKVDQDHLMIITVP